MDEGPYALITIDAAEFPEKRLGEDVDLVGLCENDHESRTISGSTLKMNGMPSQFFNPVVTAEFVNLFDTAPVGLVKPQLSNDEQPFVIRKKMHNALSQQMKKTLSGSYSVSSFTHLS